MSTLSDLLNAVHVAEYLPDAFGQRDQASAKATEALALALLALRKQGQLNVISEEMIAVVAHAREVLSHTEDHWETRAKIHHQGALSLLLIVTRDVPDLKGRKELVAYLEECFRLTWGEHAAEKIAQWRKKACV